jgi:ubiquitin carboxyl-terminal hydrolase 4/11/15
MSPFVLSKTQKSQSPLIYDLFAVSNHSGGVGGGHYTAFGKNYLTG